eukprot:4654026-Amphidinium_carterae.1
MGTNSSNGWGETKIRELGCRFLTASTTATENNQRLQDHTNENHLTFNETTTSTYLGPTVS